MADSTTSDTPTTLFKDFEEKRRFMDALMAKQNDPYCWPCRENNYSGKGLSMALYQDCYDCSGLVTVCLYEATGGRVDLRANVNAQGLYNRCKQVSKNDALPGDLVFYGPGTNMISHVMVFMGGAGVYGACGGDSTTTTPEIAKRRGARVRYRDRVDYRDDVRGYGRL